VRRGASEAAHARQHHARGTYTIPLGTEIHVVFRGRIVQSGCTDRGASIGRVAERVTMLNRPSALPEQALSSCRCSSHQPVEVRRPLRVTRPFVVRAPVTVGRPLAPAPRTLERPVFNCRRSRCEQPTHRSTPLAQRVKTPRGPCARAAADLAAAGSHVRASRRRRCAGPSQKGGSRLRVLPHGRPLENYVMAGIQGYQGTRAVRSVKAFAEPVLRIRARPD